MLLKMDKGNSFLKFFFFDYRQKIKITAGHKNVCSDCAIVAAFLIRRAPKRLNFFATIDNVNSRRLIMRQVLTSTISSQVVGRHFCVSGARRVTMRGKNSGTILRIKRQSERTPPKGDSPTVRKVKSIQTNYFYRSRTVPIIQKIKKQKYS